MKRPLTTSFAGFLSRRATAAGRQLPLFSAPCHTRRTPLPNLVELLSQRGHRPQDKLDETSPR